MIAWAPTIRPPAPRPGSARKPISCPIVWLRPDSSEPARKIRIAARNMGLRPYMSPSFPYSGVEAVVASRYDVTTHERWLRPPRSPTIVGSAVETIVWSSAARNIPSIRAPKTVHSGRPVSRPFSAAATRPRTLGLDRALRGVLVRARDELIGRLLVGRGQRAGLHAEVHGLRVVGDDRHRRLLGLDREPAR